MSSMGHLLEWLEGSVVFEDAIPGAFVNPKNIDLIDEYNVLNRKFFGGRLGIYPMKWNRSKRTGALVRYRKHRDGQIQIISIEVSQSMDISRTTFLSSLAHEMIHVYWLEKGIEDKHGRLFKQEMDRINRDSGLSIGVTRNRDELLASGEASLRESGKKFGIVSYTSPGGTFGMVVPQNRLYEYLSRMASDWMIGNMTGSRMSCRVLKSFDVHVHSGGWLDAMPHKKIGSRSMTAYLISPENSDDMKRNGKKIGVLECRTLENQKKWLESIRQEL